MAEKDGSSGKKLKNRRDAAQKVSGLTIPKLYITSDDDDTPTREIEDFPDSLSRPKGYARDEDSVSTAPLLDSGSVTPTVEGPMGQLTLSNLLSNDNLDGESTSGFQEITLLPINEKRINMDLSSENSSFPEYGFVNWNWRVIRTVGLVAVISVLLGCLGYSAGMIMQLPKQCDPPREWWQGRVFYEIFPASFYDSGTDGIGDIKGIVQKLDYLQKTLLVDGIRLNSIFQASQYPEDYLNVVNWTNIDPQIGSLADFKNLVSALESRNMTMILDLNTDRLNTSEVPAVLKFWSSQGTHGFFLKGLRNLARDNITWKTVASWKTVVDSFSSGSKRKILITDSEFLNEYHTANPETYEKLAKQFDLVEHVIDLIYPHNLRHQVLQGLNLDRNVESPWILWSYGGIAEPRVSSKLCRGLSGCQISNLGALFLLASLPGSMNLFYGDEIGLQDLAEENSTRDERSLHLHNLAIMRWTGAIHGGFTSPTALPWQPVGQNAENNNVNCMNLTLSRWQSFMKIRRSSVPLQVNTVLKLKEGSIESRTLNYQMHLVANSTVLVERFYPRRHRYLTVSHIDPFGETVDMSSIYFGGRVLVSSNGAKEGYVSFKDVPMEPVEATLFQLDK